MRLLKIVMCAGLNITCSKNGSIKWAHVLMLNVHRLYLSVDVLYLRLNRYNKQALCETWLN